MAKKFKFKVGSCAIHQPQYGVPFGRVKILSQTRSHETGENMYRVLISNKKAKYRELSAYEEDMRTCPRKR